MVDAYVSATGDEQFLRDNMDALEAEYSFWMNNRTVEVQYNGEDYTVNRYATPILQAR